MPNQTRQRNVRQVLKPALSARLSDESGTRTGGASNGDFRDALGCTLRGVASKPRDVAMSRGAEAGEVPDAFALLRAAGVEVLEVNVSAQPAWGLPGAIQRLVRSPAGVV